MKLNNREINFSEEKQIPITYKEKRVGYYKPDFIIEEKVILEIKAVPHLTKPAIDQIYFYVKGTKYKLVLLANFGTNKLSVKRRIYT